MKKIKIFIVSSLIAISFIKNTFSMEYINCFGCIYNPIKYYISEYVNYLEEDNSINFDRELVIISSQEEYNEEIKMRKSIIEEIEPRKKINLCKYLPQDLLNPQKLDIINIFDTNTMFKKSDTANTNLYSRKQLDIVCKILEKTKTVTSLNFIQPKFFINEKVINAIKENNIIKEINIKNMKFCIYFDNNTLKVEPNFNMTEKKKLIKKFLGVLSEINYNGIFTIYPEFNKVGDYKIYCQEIINDFTENTKFYPNILIKKSKTEESDNLSIVLHIEMQGY